MKNVLSDTNGETKKRKRPMSLKRRKEIIAKFIKSGKEYQEISEILNFPFKYVKEIGCILKREYQETMIARLGKDAFQHKIRREYILMKAYNLTEDDFNNLCEKQENCCMICGIHQSELNKLLAIDHNHETGKIRGLLCSNCNIGLGNFKDNITFLQNAIKYLKGEIK